MILSNEYGKRLSVAGAIYRIIFLVKIEGFLVWQEGYLGAKVESLTHSRRATASTITMAF